MKTFSEWVRDEYHIPDEERWDINLVGRDMDSAFRLLSEYIDGYFSYVAREVGKEAGTWK